MIMQILLCKILYWYFLLSASNPSIWKAVNPLVNTRVLSGGTPSAVCGPIMKQLTKSSSLKWRVAVVALLIQATASVSMAARANTNSQNSAGNWTAKDLCSSPSDNAGQRGNSEQALKKAIAKSLERFLEKNVRNNPEFAAGINLGEHEADEIINWVGKRPYFLPELLSHVAAGKLESLDWWQAYGGWHAWALEDSDNDGMTNGDELLALTDPDDAASCLVLKLVKSPVTSSVQADYVSWDAQPGCTYAVETSTDLLSGEWTILAEGLTGDQAIAWELPAVNSHAYYRVTVSR